MKYFIILLIGIISSTAVFSQADEVLEDGYRTYSVILITQNGELKNKFKEGKGITALINGKRITGNWYFKAEPDLVVIVGKKGEVLGEVSLNKQKNIKLETDEPVQRGGGMSIGIGIGPVGISSGGGSGGPRFISYNMSKNKALFDKQKETREDKIKREYAEKKYLEQQRKEQEKQAKKTKRRK